jgi:type VI secretion system secreted protein VgrG
LNKPVPKVIDAVFAGYPGAAVRWEVDAGAYPVRERTVQHDETDFAFVSRLLEGVGIAYHFEHAVEGHTLVLADGSVPAVGCDSGKALRIGRSAGVRSQCGFTAWESSRQVVSAKAAVAGYNPTAPRATAGATAAGGTAPPSAGKAELFGTQAGTSKDADLWARVRAGRAVSESKVIHASGDIPTLMPGGVVEASGESFLVTRIDHTFAATRRRGNYRNDVVLVPADHPFRPPAVTPVPRIAGSHPAVVAGPGGETDPSPKVHTDEFGRVQVRFPWDRPGPGRDGSGWVRVLHPGGQMRIPRIGEAIQCVWQHGLPDHPLVLVSELPTPDDQLFSPSADPLPVVYRQEFLDGKTVNELRMDAVQGKEKLALCGGRDVEVVAAAGYVESVGKNRTTVVGGDARRTVKGKVVEVIEKHQVAMVGGKATRLTSGEVVEASKKSIALVAGKEIVAGAKKRIVLAAGEIVLSGKTKVVIEAPDILLKGPNGTFVRLCLSGLVLEGKPLTQINCGGSAGGPLPLPTPEEPLKLPPGKEPLLLPPPEKMSRR